jgi:hypothetical protein
MLKGRIVGEEGNPEGSNTGSGEDSTETVPFDPNISGFQEKPRIETQSGQPAFQGRSCLFASMLEAYFFFGVGEVAL